MSQGHAIETRSLTKKEENVKIETMKEMIDLTGINRQPLFLVFLRNVRLRTNVRKLSEKETKRIETEKKRNEKKRKGKKRSERGAGMT